MGREGRERDNFLVFVDVRSDRHMSSRCILEVS